MTRNERPMSDVLRASIERGLAEIANGDVVDLGDFAKFADDPSATWDPMAGVLDDHDGNVEWPPHA